MSAPEIDPAERGWGEPLEGWHYEWVVDTDWRMPSQYTRCRANAGSGRKACGLPPAADLDRRARWRKDDGPNWWAYCAIHLYGRVVHDGALWSVRAVRDEAP